MITYKTGNPHFEGQTSFRVSETGEAVVEQTCGAETRRFAQVLGAETYQRMNGLLTRAREQPSAPVGVPVPGENQVCIERLEPTGAVRLEFWANQRWDNACLDALVHGLEQAVTQTSGGEVKF
ncbi:MAG TPA: hypothetical protein VGD78_11935 [Chthoniobacterales bacterium]